MKLIESRISFFAAASIFFSLTIFASSLMSQPVRKAPAKTISGGVLNGKAVSLPKPEYPADAIKTGLSGTVSIQVLIDETGMVVSAKAVGGLENPSLRQACEVAAMRATFTPTLLSGQPAKVSGVITYNFVGPDYAEKLKVTALGALFRISRHFASDWSNFKTSFDADDLIKDGVADPDFSDVFVGLAKIENLTPDKRLEAIDKAFASVKTKLAPSERWQFDTGQELGDIMGSIMIVAGVEGEPDLSKINEANIKLSLNKIRDLTLSAPSDFPPDVLAKLKEFAAMGSKDKLTTEENLEALMNKMMALINTISPDLEK